jgi:hypothetical protein
VPDVLAAEETVGNAGINIAIFGVFVLITLFITFRAGRTNRSATDYYAAWRSPATTCPQPPSWASPAPSRSSATTASCTRSASWSPGWSRCCSSRS